MKNGKNLTLDKNLNKKGMNTPPHKKHRLKQKKQKIEKDIDLEKDTDLDIMLTQLDLASLGWLVV